MLVTLLVGALWLVAWSAAGFFAFKGGVEAAQHRLPPNARTALSPGKGFLLSDATTILMLGTDNSTASARSGDHHADSIMLVRTDPSQHRIAYLSIPRDLLVERARVRRPEDQCLLPVGRRRTRDHDDQAAFTGVTDQPCR